MLSKEKVYRAYFLMTMLVLALCGCYAMLLNDGANEVHGVGLVFLFSFAILLPGYAYYLHSRISRRPDSPILRFSTLLVWMSTVTLFSNAANIYINMFQCLNAAIPLVVLCSTYTFSERYGSGKSIYWMAFIILLIFVAQYVRIYKVANLTDEAHLITAYYPLFILPLVLMHPSKVIKYTSILIVTLVIFSSFKRGGFIALIGSLVVYTLCYSRIKSRGMKAVIYTVIGLSILLGLFYYISVGEYGGVIERLQNIHDDNGSGRVSVWNTTWRMIQDSESLPYLFGHGSNAVVKDSPLFLSAHNDFLEAWYDYGLLGFALYIISLVTLIRYTIHLQHKGSEVAPSMAMQVTIMLVLTFISHVLIYYFITLSCLTIGMLAGQNNYYEHNQSDHI